MKVDGGCRWKSKKQKLERERGEKAAAFMSQAVDKPFRDILTQPLNQD